MRLAQDGRIVRAYPAWKERDSQNLSAFCTRLRQDGLHVPRYDLIRAPRWGTSSRPCVYLVLDSIAGERLDQIARPTRLDWLLPIPKRFFERFYDEIDDFLLKIFTHYQGLLKCGGLVYTVMDESQFIYGTVSSDRRPTIYFVDLDPTFNVVPSIDQRRPGINPNESKPDFEKPINMLFEMKLLHPEASLRCSTEKAKEYFASCSDFFVDFYSANNTPWWARSPNFIKYQQMKKGLFGVN